MGLSQLEWCLEDSSHFVSYPHPHLNCISVLHANLINRNFPTRISSIERIRAYLMTNDTHRMSSSKRAHAKDLLTVDADNWIIKTEPRREWSAKGKVSIHCFLWRFDLRADTEDNGPLIFIRFIRKNCFWFHGFDDKHEPLISRQTERKTRKFHRLIKGDGDKKGTFTNPNFIRLWPWTWRNSEGSRHGNTNEKLARAGVSVSRKYFNFKTQVSFPMKISVKGLSLLSIDNS